MKVSTCELTRFFVCSRLPSTSNQRRESSTIKWRRTTRWHSTRMSGWRRNRTLFACHAVVRLSCCHQPPHLLVCSKIHLGQLIWIHVVRVGERSWDNLCCPQTKICQNHVQLQQVVSVYTTTWASHTSTLGGCSSWWCSCQTRRHNVATAPAMWTCSTEDMSITNFRFKRGALPTCQHESSTSRSSSTWSLSRTTSTTSRSLPASSHGRMLSFGRTTSHGGQQRSCRRKHWWRSFDKFANGNNKTHLHRAGKMHPMVQQQFQTDFQYYGTKTVERLRGNSTIWSWISINYDQHNEDYVNKTTMPTVTNISNKKRRNLSGKRLKTMRATWADHNGDSVWSLKKRSRCWDDWPTPTTSQSTRDPWMKDPQQNIQHESGWPTLNEHMSLGSTVKYSISPATCKSAYRHAHSRGGV